MTDQDNLRDKIAECQRRALKRRALISDVNLPAYLAQAIIDELHLFAEVDEDWGAMVIEGWWEKQ